MFRENGRTKPADQKEIAKIKVKKITCINCGEVEVAKVTFGEPVTCPVCKEVLKVDF